MFLGYGIHEWSEAAIIIGALATGIATLTKLFIRNEFKSLTEGIVTMGTNIKVMMADLVGINTRLSHLEQLPDRVTRIEVDLYKALASTATKEELYKHAENTSSAIQRIHDRIDRIGEQ